MPDMSYWKVLTRRKTLTVILENDTKLSRIMGTYDLTALGVGATLGVGVYVLAGHVAKEQAGPSVVLSFAIAALASLLAGLCYAEFGARVPKAGSAYIYSYVCIGEFAAFIIGWNLIMEYIIGSASVCRGISLYLDTLINDTLKNTFIEVAPIEWGFMATYFDFLAFSLAATFGICLTFGFQASTVVNNFCTILNIGVVIFVIVAGSINADIRNWQVDPSTVNVTEFTKPPKLGVGGFFPFGIEGTIRGAATCFFGFVGFDCIATTGEEVRDPRRAIPRAILFSLFIIFVSYFGVSTVLTLMWPYYLQDVDAPLPYAFQEIGWPTAKWIVTIGGMIGLVASLVGAMFPLPRIIYAMAMDGLIFRCLGSINPRFKTPVIGSICAAILTGIIAGIFDLSQLVNMLSIGTLMAYTVVAISITILRFMDNSKSKTSLGDVNENSILMNDNKIRTTYNSVIIQIFNYKRLKIPNDLSTRIVCALLMIYCLSCLGFTLTLMYAKDEITSGVPWSIILLTAFSLFNIILILTISIQPREEKNPYFTVPLVPLIPGISIFVNIYLMLQLDIYTWIRFTLWMSIGLIIYLACVCLYERSSNYNENLTNTYRAFSIGFVNQAFDPDPVVKPNASISMVMTIENGEMMERPSKTPSPKSSLDEIVLASDIENLQEKKHANGNTFFIETNSTSPVLSPKKSESNSEAAKSALAILDNVLQHEESEVVEFNRKTSIDSEMIPSFVDISTSATVHNSGDCLKEEEESSSRASESSEISSVKDQNSETVNSNEKTFYIGSYSDAESNKSMSAIKDSLIEDKLNNYEQNAMDIESKLDEIHSSTETIRPTSPNENTNTGHDHETSIQSNLNQRQDGENDNKMNLDLVTEIIPPSSEVKEEVLQKLENNTEQLKDKNIDSNRSEFLSEIIALKNNQKNIEPKKCSKNDDSSDEDKIDKTQPKETPSELKTIEKPVSRKTSVISNSSVYDDPIHSDNFKAKLARLMMQQPPLVPAKKEEKPALKEHTDFAKSEPAEGSTSPLKVNKSEADIRNLVLKAIAQTNNEETIASSENNTSNIPKAPKFDPILYKSVGPKSYSHFNARPKLDELVGTKIEHKPKEQETKKAPEVEEDEANPLPFKEKLAALIKRGPSYKIQRQLPPNSPRNSVEPIQNSKNNYLDVVNAIRKAKRLSNQSQNFKDDVSNNNNDKVEISSYEDTRKSLRPQA